MSGCPHDIPAMRVSKGNVRPTTDVSSGHLMYNTEHNYLEIYHSDSNNPTGWRDLVMNNKEQIDISGKLVVDGDVSFNAHLSVLDASFQNNADIAGKLTCATVPTSGSDLCNKTYVDSIKQKTGYENEFGDSFSYSVSAGNASLAFNTQGNNHGGRMNDSLNADIVIPTGHSGKVLVTFNVSGEWSSSAWDKGVILGRATLQADGTTFTYDKLIRHNLSSTSGLVISNFLVSYHGNDDSTLEQSSGAIMDDTITAGNTYRYTPILVNTHWNTGNHTFKLNRAISNSTSIDRERACSSVTAQLVNISP